jgi:hypothetical protein
MSDITYRGSSVNTAIENALAKQATVSKAGITTSTGITAYDLEPKALGLYYDEVPLLEMVPRAISHNGDTMTHWKSITNVDVYNVNMGTQEGQRTGSITPNVQVKSRAYATLGKETDYTFEAEEAAESFDNLPEKATSQLLSAFRIGESKVVGYGNATYPLGTPSAPTATVGTAAGTLPAASYVLRVVPLSYEGVQYASVLGGVVTTYTRQNNDGSTTTIPGGSGIASAASAAVTLNATGSVNGFVTAIPNACGYAWYIGSNAGTAVLAAITTTNVVTITAPAAGSQLASAITVDNSANGLIYDGLFTQFADPTSNSFYTSLDGSTLTADGAGGIEQFSEGFQYMWDNFKFSPTDLVCGGLVKRAINKAVFSSSGPVYRIDLPSGSESTAGNDVSYLLNPITGSKIKITVDPWAPGNFAATFTTKLPYMAPDVPVPFKLQTRMRDYYQIKWPITTRTAYQGIYYSGVMKVHAAFSGGIFANINTAGV